MVTVTNKLCFFELTNCGKMATPIKKTVLDIQLYLHSPISPESKRKCQSTTFRDLHFNAHGCMYYVSLSYDISNEKITISNEDTFVNGIVPSISNLKK